MHHNRHMLTSSHTIEDTPYCTSRIFILKTTCEHSKSKMEIPTDHLYLIIKHGLLLPVHRRPFFYAYRTLTLAIFSARCVSGTPARYRLAIVLGWAFLAPPVGLRARTKSAHQTVVTIGRDRATKITFCV